jgi:membrane protease YdiL (CAAX protease family)
MNPDALIVKIFRFLVKPNWVEESNIRWYRKLWNIIRIWGFYVSFAFVFAIISNILLALLSYPSGDFAVNNFVQNETFWFVFFYGIIWAPITEELTFRMGLIFSPFRIALSLVSFTLFTILLFNIPIFPKEIFGIGSFSTLIEYLLFVIVVTPVLGFVLRIRILKDNFEKLHHRIFRFLLYFTSIAFGLAHISNYLIGINKIWFIIPLLIAPQLTFGFILGFIRVKYGFKWSVYSHMLNTFMTLLPALLISMVSPRVIELMQSGSTNWLSSVSIGDTVLMLLALLLFFVMLMISVVSTISILIELFSKKK